jgi:hypothetical protein
VRAALRRFRRADVVWFVLYLLCLLAGFWQQAHGGVLARFLLGGGTAGVVLAALRLGQQYLGLNVRGTLSWRARRELLRAFRSVEHGEPLIDMDGGQVFMVTRQWPVWSVARITEADMREYTSERNLGQETSTLAETRFTYHWGDMWSSPQVMVASGDLDDLFIHDDPPASRRQALLGRLTQQRLAEPVTDAGALELANALTRARFIDV